MAICATHVMNAHGSALVAGTNRHKQPRLSPSYSGLAQLQPVTAWL